MKRLILLLIIVIAVTLLSQSRTLVPLGGTDGMSLLRSMANVTSNLTENNSTTINLSSIPSSAELGGAEGEDQLSNLINGSSNDTNLSTWGSTPRSPPLPPSAESMRTAKFHQIIRDNHIA